MVADSPAKLGYHLDWLSTSHFLNYTGVYGMAEADDASTRTALSPLRDPLRFA